jgi:hypothetical protein
MRAFLAIPVAFVLVAFGIMCQALAAMCQDEIRARLGHLPYALIRLTALRLPKDARDDLADEWTAELDVMLSDTENLPLTRLWTGLRFAVSLLRVPPSEACELTGTTPRRGLMALKILMAADLAFLSVAFTIATIRWFYSHHIVAGADTACFAIGCLITVVSIFQKNPRRRAGIFAVLCLMLAAVGFTQYRIGAGFLGLILTVAYLTATLSPPSAAAERSQLVPPS